MRINNLKEEITVATLLKTYHLAMEIFESFSAVLCENQEAATIMDNLPLRYSLEDLVRLELFTDLDYRQNRTTICGKDENSDDNGMLRNRPST